MGHLGPMLLSGAYFEKYKHHKINSLILFEENITHYDLGPSQVDLYEKVELVYKDFMEYLSKS